MRHKQTLETRRKITESLKTQWKNGSRTALRKKGFKMSEEQKRKIGLANSLSLRGRKLSLDSILKRTQSRKGYRHSEDTRKKIGSQNSIALKGKKLTKTHIRNISNAHKNRRELNHLWKGGITSKNQKIRGSLEIRLWRKAVFERDNFTCQKTKQRGGELVAHHINNFSDFPELRTSIGNGITLSKKSHREFHKKYGVKNNTVEQLIEFLK